MLDKGKINRLLQGVATQYESHLHFSTEVSSDSIFGYLRLEMMREILKTIAEEKWIKYSPLIAEKIVVELKKRGVSDEQINFKTNAFWITLTNYKYKIRKSDRCIKIKPLGVVPYISTATVSEKRFAEFLLFYDTIIPEIRAKAAEVYQRYRVKLEKIKRQEVAYTICSKTIESLIKEYLTPLKLEVSYSINNTEGESPSVSLTVKETKSCNLNLPFPQIVELLNNPKGITDLLQVEEPENHIRTSTLPPGVII